MLRINRLTYRIGPRVLIDDASASINPGHKVGFVGRNGTGKTTLLRLITGALEADEGSIEVPGRWRIGITSQEAPDGPQSLIDTVLAADKELMALSAEAEDVDDPHRIADVHARLKDIDAHTARARAAKILAGLGFDEAAQQRPCSEYSGGWRMRVALAALLFTEPDLLLLDEPTNHLDLEAALWLEDYLKTYRGTILLVSHDRDLLNRVVDEILHLEHCKLTLYQGGYDRFEQTRRMQLELDAKMRVKQDVQRAHIQAFVDRFRFKASKARQAQSRIKMLEKMQPIAEERLEYGITFQFPDPDPLAPPLYTTEDVSVGYDGKPVLSHLDLRLDDDDRIALLGANGHGKSTLIKLLARKLQPLSGEIVRSKKLRVGYFAQHQADELDLGATPIIELGRRRPRDREEQLRTQLGRFGFTQQRAETKVGHLSGGEKARLLFALMTCDKPHILLLDEPTNHLDVDSRQALVQAINAYKGAVVIVSHDPHIIELTADRLWLVDNGTVAPFDGDLEDYRAFLLGKARDARGQGKSAKEATGLSKKQRRQQAAGARAARSDLKKRLKAAERRIEILEARKTELEEALADPALYDGKNTDQTVALQKKLAATVGEIAAAEVAWSDLQETWDNGKGSA